LPDWLRNLGTANAAWSTKFGNFGLEPWDVIPRAGKPPDRERERNSKRNTTSGLLPFTQVQLYFHAYSPLKGNHPGKGIRYACNLDHPGPIHRHCRLVPGGRPFGNLIADSSGDLFGTASDGTETASGPADTLFEVTKAPSGYSPTDLAVLPESIDAEGLVTDANGDLFGSTLAGGANSEGDVFEVTKSASGGYAISPQTLVSFDGVDGLHPNGSLFVDSSEDLFGTTSAGGASALGTVFEIKSNAGVYAITPATLANFSSDDNGGTGPQGSLIADATGDLFGTTTFGGAHGDGAVFEIKKIAGGYATTATTLASSPDLAGSIGDLVADANGDLFGTTTLDHEVFEIVKTLTSPTGYASTPTILASVPIDDGQLSDGSNSLIVDANGDLFGTTDLTSQGFGSVFEIVNTPTGYEKTPRVVISFNGHDGTDPETTLIADAEGDLFGTTSLLSGSEPGTVFEVTGSGISARPLGMRLTRYRLKHR
jgi:hypothetical protein